jgi:hypothetical protein
MTPDVIRSRQVMPALSPQAPLSFWDGSKHRSWVLAAMAADHLSAKPGALATIEDRIAELRADPHSAHVVAAWDEASSEGVASLTHRLVAMTPDGEFLRDCGLHALALPLELVEEANRIVARQRSLGQAVYGSDP